MFRSSMRSSSGSYLFISLSKLLILKTIKIFKKYYHPSWLCGSICLVCCWYYSVVYEKSCSQVMIFVSVSTQLFKKFLDFMELGSLLRCSQESPLSQIKPIQTFTLYLFKIHLSTHLQNCEEWLSASPNLSVCPSIHPSVCLSISLDRLGSHWTNFHQILYMILLKKSVKKL